MTDTPIDQDLTQRVQEFLEALSELSQRTGIMITGLRIYAATNRRTLRSAARIGETTGRSALLWEYWCDRCRVRCRCERGKFLGSS